MKRTKRLLRKKWDETFYDFIKARFYKFESEFAEHASLMKWVALRILAPLAIFYMLAGLLVFEVYLVGSLFLGSLFFVYSNFLPDLDSLIIVTKNKKLSSRWFYRYSLLLFAPLFIYYAVSGHAKPIYADKPKEFHGVDSLITYIVFLFVLGFLFWRNPIQHTILPVFGGLGYLTHLVVDKMVLDYGGSGD